MNDDDDDQKRDSYRSLITLDGRALGALLDGSVCVFVYV